jgi:hypothetical protein
LFFIHEYRATEKRKRGWSPWLAGWLVVLPCLRQAAGACVVACVISFIATFSPAFWARRGVGDRGVVNVCWRDDGKEGLSLWA